MMNQTYQRINNESIKDKKTCNTHYNVGYEIRNTTKNR